MTNFVTLDLFELDDLFKNVQSREFGNVTHEEKHMQALVQHFQGDDYIIEEIYMEVQRESRMGKVLIEDYALKLSQEQPPISLYEIKDVLEHYGSIKNSSEVDL